MDSVLGIELQIQNSVRLQWQGLVQFKLDRGIETTIIQITQNEIVELDRGGFVAMVIMRVILSIEAR